MQNTESLVEVVSQEQKEAALKSKYSNMEVFLLEIDLSDEIKDFGGTNAQKKAVFQAVLKKPGRRELGLAMAAGKDPLQMAESLIKSCWLEGDEEIKDLQYEDTIGLHACMQAMELLNVGNKGKLRKL
ncbi:hypothetical protein ACWA1C_06595 [Flectobacillus roseus]